MEVDQPSSSSSSAPKKRFEVWCIMMMAYEQCSIVFWNCTNISAGQEVERCCSLGLGYSGWQLCYLSQSYYGSMHRVSSKSDICNFRRMHCGMGSVQSRIPLPLHFQVAQDQTGNYQFVVLWNCTGVVQFDSMTWWLRVTRHCPYAT